MGQILQCIRSEAKQSRHLHYQQPPPSFSNTCEQQPQRLIPNVLQKSFVVTEQQVPNDPIAASDTSGTASTTPTSDTTASDTDPGENFSANGTPDETPMDDNENNQ